MASFPPLPATQPINLTQELSGLSQRYKAATGPYARGGFLRTFANPHAAMGAAAIDRVRQMDPALFDQLDRELSSNDEDRITTAMQKATKKHRELLEQGYDEEARALGEHIQGRISEVVQTNLISPETTARYALGSQPVTLPRALNFGRGVHDMRATEALEAERRARETYLGAQTQTEDLTRQPTIEEILARARKSRAQAGWYGERATSERELRGPTGDLLRARTTAQGRARGTSTGPGGETYITMDQYQKHFNNLLKQLNEIASWMPSSEQRRQPIIDAMADLELKLSPADRARLRERSAQEDSGAVVTPSPEPSTTQFLPGEQQLATPKPEETQLAEQMRKQVMEQIQQNRQEAAPTQPAPAPAQQPPGFIYAPPDLWEWLQINKGWTASELQQLGVIPAP